MRFMNVSSDICILLLVIYNVCGAAIKDEDKEVEETKNNLARLLDEVLNYDENVNKDDTAIHADQWLKGRFGREMEQWLKGRFGRDASSDQWLKGRFGDQWLKGRFGRELDGLANGESTYEQWLKGRFGRGMDQWLKGRFGRENKDQWLKGRFGREMSEESELNQWLKGRFGREMADQWLKGRFGRDIDSPSESDVIVDDLAEDYNKEIANTFETEVNQWLKGRFGREMNQWLKGRFGRELDQWLKGRFGDEEKKEDADKTVKNHNKNEKDFKKSAKE